MMWNETFVVAAVSDCATLHNSPQLGDYLWRETVVGCKLLLLLQEMHQFNTTYITGSQKVLDYYERMGAIYEFDEAVDIYAKPRTLWPTTLHNASPILPIYVWKFGFILRSPKVDVQHFYSLPFAPSVWQCLMAMILLVSVLFYILNRAEQRLLGDNLECFFLHELLIAIGACCQHYLPVNPMGLTSRRIAFISFFLFSYLIYSYYTSTLLSDIVHDRDNEMDLETLADSSYGYVVLDRVAVIIKAFTDGIHNKNTNKTFFRFIQKKLMDFREVNITTGLEEVKTGDTALLSDYLSLYPAIRQTYDINLECELIKVHLFPVVLKYFFTSKNFKYVEEFKIRLWSVRDDLGDFLTWRRMICDIFFFDVNLLTPQRFSIDGILTLWAKETGVLQRLLKTDTAPSLLDIQCNNSHFQAQFGHIRRVLIGLAYTYILCTLILLGERFYYTRYRVWPYVE